MGSYFKNSTTKKQETDNDDHDDGALTGAGVAVAAAGFAALAAWGISKLFVSTSDDPQLKRHDQMMIASSSRPTNTSNDQNNHVRNISSYIDRVPEKKWEKPKPGRYKLNTDGSSRKQPYEVTGPATAGGLIRNHRGEWVVGFTAELPDCDGVTSELQAIRIGMQLAWERGYENKLEVETDCDQAVRFISDRFLNLQKYKDDSIVSIVTGCRELMDQLGVGIDDLRVVDRSQNECADRLTKVRPVPPGEIAIWEEISDLPNTHRKNVDDVFNADKNKSTQPGTY